MPEYSLHIVKQSALTSLPIRDVEEIYDRLLVFVLSNMVLLARKFILVKHNWFLISLHSYGEF